jgi:hypothetical protein
MQQNITFVVNLLSQATVAPQQAYYKEAKQNKTSLHQRDSRLWILLS